MVLEQKEVSNCSKLSTPRAQYIRLCTFWSRTWSCHITAAPLHGFFGRSHMSPSPISVYSSPTILKASFKKSLYSHEGFLFFRLAGNNLPLLSPSAFIWDLTALSLVLWLCGHSLPRWDFDVPRSRARVSLTFVPAQTGWIFGTWSSLAVLPAKHTQLVKKVYKSCAKAEPDKVSKGRWAEVRSPQTLRKILCKEVSLLNQKPPGRRGERTHKPDRPTGPTGHT